MNPNIKAFLDMISVSEGTARYPYFGYKTIVGGQQFHSYADHPRIKVWIEMIGDYSTCAGRYQIKRKNYDFYKRALMLSDFGPDSQDRIAIQLICECGAYRDIINGNISTAIKKCASRWASFEGAGYGQKEHKISFLVAAYQQSGGSVA